VRFRFAEDRAARAVEFFQTLLVHTKGAYARQPFILDPFQRDDIIRPLFGSMMEDPDTLEWVRQYTLAWIEMARKNGKSEVLAGTGLLLTGGDDEEGAEVYGVAKDTDQASLVFNVARRMVELSPVLSKHFTIYPTNRRIVYAKTSSFYRVIAADALGNLGHDPHGILFDEVIAQPNGDLWDALKTGFGARRQPLMIAATTAGDDMADFARQEHEFSEKVAADPSLDPRRFVYIRNLPKDADWRDESRWGEPNPALGSFLRPQVLRDELTSAMNHPREERRFRMFRLNQWQTGAEEGVDWDWAESVGSVVEDKLKGKRCWGGLVARTAQDLTALHWLFRSPDKPDEWWALWRHFLPEGTLASLDDRTGNDASLWAKDKLAGLRITEGNEIDIPAITAQIRADAAVFDVAELAYDPNGAIGIVQPVIAEDLVTVVPINANAQGSSLVEWETFVRSKKYLHGGNPVIAWQMRNLILRESVGGITKIDPKLSHDVVPGVVAAELALRRALLAQEKKASPMVLTYQ
jgi:phage terminase large subunit-like protein